MGTISNNFDDYNLGSLNGMSYTTPSWSTTWAVSTPDLPELPKVLRLFKTNKEIQKFLKEYEAFKLDYQYIKGYVKGTNKTPEYDWQTTLTPGGGSYNVPYTSYNSLGGYSANSTAASSTNSLGMHLSPGQILHNRVNGLATDAVVCDEVDYKKYQKALMDELKDLKKLSKK